MAKTKHTAKRIHQGWHQYRGFDLKTFPTKKFYERFWVIEKDNITGHAPTLAKAKRDVDKYLDDGNKEAIQQFNLKTLPPNIWNNTRFGKKI